MTSENPYDLDIKQNDNYLKIKPGESVKIHLLTKKPKVEMIHWVNKKKISCLAPCPECSQGDKPKQRFSVNVWDWKANKIKAFEFGPMIGKQLKSINSMLAEAEQTVHDVDFMIRAEITGGKTEYQVMQVAKKEQAPVQYEEEFTINVTKSKPQVDEAPPEVSPSVPF